jgi:hypothetical protein
MVVLRIAMQRDTRATQEETPDTEREAQILLLRRFHEEKGKERETSIPTAAALLTHGVDSISKS